jgi:RNA polymerase sigma factor (sigma-70 family)
VDIIDSNEDEALQSLTRRERQTLDLFLKGMTMKEVAQNLDVSVSTVNTYSNSLYRKLKVYSRAQLLLKCHKLIGN